MRGVLFTQVRIQRPSGKFEEVVLVLNQSNGISDSEERGS
jgi:hypothetical protein